MTPRPPADHTIVFVHGNVSSSLFWQEIMLDLPADLRPIAVDLRGFGGTETLPVDATRGLGDFVRRLREGDTSDQAQTSPRSVFRATYVSPGYTSEHEDIWITSMLSTSTEPGNYPGDATSSAHWPGFASGGTGVLNTMTPGHFNASGIVDLVRKPGILWVHGTADAIVSDASFFDLNHLGAVGAVPEWPGAEVAPAQEMVSQTREVLDAYAAAGGDVIELSWEGVGHAPHLERPAEFIAALLTRIAS